jgi:hypothetical protein
MGSVAWKNSAELVGLAAIVGSLIFVGLQMEQSHEIALSEAYQQRSAMTSDAFFALSENDNALAALLVAIPSDTSEVPDGISPKELIAFQYWMLGMMAALENVHYQYQIGFMTEESWLRSRNSLKAQLRINAIAHPVLQIAKRGMGQSFREEVERIEAEVGAE